MLGLQSRFTITIAALIVGIIALLAGALLFQFSSQSDHLIDTTSQKMSETLLNQMEKRGETIAHLLADNLVNPFYTYNMSEIYELLQSVKHQKDVLYALVYDNEKKLIHDGTKDVFDYGKPLKDAENQLALGTKHQAISLLNGNILEVSIPLSIDKTPLGGLKIGLSMDGVKEDTTKVLDELDQIGNTGLEKNYYTVAWTSLVLITIGVFLALGVARRLIRPIKEVSTYTGKVGGGDYGNLISSKRTDELGDLINAFNQMSENLLESTVTKDYVESIISNMSDPLIVLRHNGNIKDVNWATISLLKYTKEELIDQ